MKQSLQRIKVLLARTLPFACASFLSIQSATIAQISADGGILDTLLHTLFPDFAERDAASDENRTNQRLSVSSGNRRISTWRPRTIAVPSTSNHRLRLNADNAPGSPGGVVLGRHIQIDINAGVQQLSLPRQGFGVRQFGGADQFGIIRPNANVNGPYGEFTVSGPLGGPIWKDKLWIWGPSSSSGNPTPPPPGTPTATPFWSFTVHGGSVSGSQGGLGADVGPGANFAVPFSGGGGVFLGAHPLNVVTNGTYDFSLTQVGVRAKVGVDVPFLFFPPGTTGDGPPGAGPPITTFSPFVSTSFTHTSSNQRFTASIPGFLRDFSYTTNLDINSFGIGAGAAVTVPIFQTLATRVSLFTEAGAEIRFTSLSGNDVTTFTGFPDSSARLSDNKVSPAFSAQGGVRIKTLFPAAPSGGPSSITFEIAGFFKQEPNTAVATRNSFSPAFARIKNSRAIGAKVSVFGEF